jgi:hypothetical protein
VTMLLLTQNETKTLNISALPKVGFGIKINVLAKTNVSAVEQTKRFRRQTGKSCLNVLRG